MRSYPLPVHEERLPGIYQLAPTTQESMGNTPYLIVREEGNIMIDVPRRAPPSVSNSPEACTDGCSNYPFWMPVLK